MTTPFDRPERDPRVEDALRASLYAHAADAPDGHALAERILAATEDAPAPAPRRSFALPAVAATLVAGIVGIVLAVALSTSDSPQRPAAHSSPALPSVVHPTPSTTAATHSSADATHASGPADTSTLHGVRVVDLTFTGQDDGWALASADCIHGPGRCTALMRTTDGRTWVSHPGSSPFQVPGVDNCAAPCVQHIRFADDQVGYAYSPGVLFMTTDGGATWQQQDGGALALETARGNVVRLVRDGKGIQARTAKIGSTSWTTRPLGAPAGLGTQDVALARDGEDVYALLVGAADSPWVSGVFRSTDGGTTWSGLGNPCPRTADGRYGPTAIASGSNGRVALTCRLPQTPMARLITSVDAGAHFTDLGAVPQRSGLLALGPNGVYLLALDSLSRTRDGGKHWADVPRIQPNFTWLGFESDRVGRVVSDGGTTIWTTRDGGTTWSEVHFA